MKTKLGVIIVVFLASLIIGAAQPAMLYAGIEGEGTLWDPFIDTSSFKGIHLTGPISIVYNPNLLAIPCETGMPRATMFYTVRLKSSIDSQIYSFVGATEGVCLGDVGIPGSGGQGDVIMNFLGTVVNNNFPGAVWRLKAINNPIVTPEGLAFVADIKIAVKP
jgi:hypothetical protein